MGGAEVLSIIGSADAHGGCTLEITDICLAGTISAPAEMNYAMRHRRNRQGRQATDAAAAARSERKAAKLRLQSFGRTSRPSASRPAYEAEMPVGAMLTIFPLSIIMSMCGESDPSCVSTTVTSRRMSLLDMGNFAT
jgi:hypothetical protein